MCSQLQLAATDWNSGKEKKKSHGQNSVTAHFTSPAGNPTVLEYDNALCNLCKQIIKDRLSNQDAHFNIWLQQLVHLNKSFLFYWDFMIEFCLNYMPKYYETLITPSANI